MGSGRREVGGLGAEGFLRVCGSVRNRATDARASRVMSISGYQASASIFSCVVQGRARATVTSLNILRLHAVISEGLPFGACVLMRFTGYSASWRGLLDVFSGSPGITSMRQRGEPTHAQRDRNTPQVAAALL